jgi:Fe-S cluster biogenesis protein NfuA
MYDAVQRVLADVRKALGLHGGGIDLISVEEETGTVTVKLTGTCVGCSLSALTMKRGVEESLCRNIPAVRRVIDLSST